MNKAIVAIIAVIVVLVGGFFLFSKKTAMNPPSSQKAQAPSYSAPAPPPAKEPAVSAPATSGQAPAQQDVVLKTSSSPSLGTFLVAPNSMTLYKYTKDTAGVTNCYDQCAVNWPPYIVTSSAALKADSSVKGAITTVKRNDGTLQVAYNGMPLYYWINDKAVGDTTGQNVGGVWFVVNP